MEVKDIYTLPGRGCFPIQLILNGSERSTIPIQEYMIIHS